MFAETMESDGEAGVTVEIVYSLLHVNSYDIVGHRMVG